MIASNMYGRLCESVFSRGRTLPRLAPAAMMALLAGFPGPTSAQVGKICDLKINSTPGLPSGGACLDLTRLASGGAVLQTASNTTRIGKDSVMLCASSFEVATAGDADIVFIYDNSASMIPAHVYVNAAASPPDTQFYWGSLLGCPTAATTGQVAYQTLEGPRNVVKLDRACNRENLAGDPYFARGAAMKQAVDYLFANSKGSTVGALAFGSSNDHLRPSLPLSDPANVQRLKDTLRLNDLGATFYGPALRQANTWLANPTLTRNPKKAIVFVSDGAPTDSNTYLSAVNAGTPIYGIFLGDARTPYQRLEALSTRTGGRFFRVDPKDITGMNKVMDAIVQAITARAYPDSIQITNTSLTPPQTSRSLRNDMIVHPDGRVTPRLDSIIALREGQNALTVRLFFRDTTRQYNLSIQADGPAAADTTRQWMCRDNARLAMLNPQGQPDATYPAASTAYSVRLTRTSNDIPFTGVAATSEDASRPQPWGDLESLTLPLTGNAGGVATYLLGNYPFHGNIPLPTPRNGTLEASPNGKVALSWTHPRDPREFARYELPAGNSPVLALFHNGVEISEVTPDQALLEIRLQPGSGFPCTACRVEAQPSASADRETVPLSAGTGDQRGTFTRALSATPAPGDGRLQHRISDSIVLLYRDPANPQTVVLRRSYPFIPSSAPTLALYHNGVELSQVNYDQTSLEIRLVPPGGVDCNGCRAGVLPSGSPDREAIALRPDQGYFTGTFTRGLSNVPVSGDGKLQHLAGDSIVLFYQNPVYPFETVRRSYPFLPPPGTLEVSWHNSIANADAVLEGRTDKWVLAGPAPLSVTPTSGSGACCGRIDWPVSRADSLRYVGIQVAVSDPFSVEMQVFSNFGELVGKVGFSVPQSEFDKLPYGPGDTTRILTLLWGNRSGEGRLAGTGAYVVRAKVTLANGRLGWSQKRTWGVVRARDKR